MKIGGKDWKGLTVTEAFVVGAAMFPYVMRLLFHVLTFYVLLRIWSYFAF